MIIYKKEKDIPVPISQLLNRTSKFLLQLRIIKMKTALVFAVLECFLFINCLQHFGLAAPTSQTNSLEDVSAVSSDVKRDADNRNALFGAYICRVTKATNVVVSKLQVRF